MKAVVFEGFGRPLAAREVATPAIGARTVLVRQQFSSICAGDLLVYEGRPLVARPAFALMLRPPVLGREVAGRVEAVGEGVVGLKVGDLVAGEVPHAWAEQVAAEEGALTKIPEVVDPKVAALLTVSGMTALQGMRDLAHVERGDRVLVCGASGGVGHLAVQIARALGAEVTAVCSASKADRVRALGANEVIDYRKEDFTARRGAWNVIFDLAGDKPLSACLGALAEGGIYVSSAGTNGGRWLGPLPRIVQVAARGVWDKRARMLASSSKSDDLALLMRMVAEGSLRPHIDSELPFEEASEGLSLLREGKIFGKCSLRVASGSGATAPQV